MAEPTEDLEQAAAGEAPSNAGRGSKSQVVFMLGASHGAGHGQRKSVTPELAESLVARGLARYPKNKR